MSLYQIQGFNCGGAVPDNRYYYIAGNVTEAVNRTRTAIVHCCRVEVENMGTRKPPIEFLDVREVSEQAIHKAD